MAVTDLNHEEVEQLQVRVLSKSLQSTISIGIGLASLLSAGDVITLNGELGAGKTQLTRGIAQGLGFDRHAVTSPTYVLMQEYDGDLPVLHLDAYRLSGPDEVDTVGWNDETREGAISVIEWADRIEEALPSSRLSVAIEHVSETERELTLTAFGPRWISCWSSVLETLKESGFEVG